MSMIIRKYYRDTTVFGLNFGYFKYGSAVALPGIGIFVGKSQIDNIELLQHEYGHILQYKLWGALFFWFRIAPTSIISAISANRNKKIHQYTWTEWSANRLMYYHMDKPASWNLLKFPIDPPLHTDINKLNSRIKSLFK